MPADSTVLDHYAAMVSLILLLARSVMVVLVATKTAVNFVAMECWKLGSCVMQAPEILTLSPTLAEPIAQQPDVAIQ